MTRDNVLCASQPRRGFGPARLTPMARGFARHFSDLIHDRISWGILASIPGIAIAGPTGESVVAGNVNVTRPDALRTEIQQASQNAIVNWNTFSINGDEYVLINQPNASAAILNRVIGSQQSRILGQLKANGRVFLVNPHGVYVAAGAKIDVGALTLSALDIRDDDFLTENYVFTGDPSTRTSIENAGTITTADGGYVVLAGDYVNNSGVITAKLGSVVLAAGEQITMDVGEDGLIGFAVDEKTLANLAGVENLGEIIADGGRVVMTADVANDLVATAVNNEGLIQAHKIVENGGEVFLQGNGADVIHTGKIDAAGESGHSGGRVVLHSDKDVIVQSDSQIIATGSGQTKGGTVRLIADGKLEFRRGAEINAAGGETGSGGLVELSGHRELAVRGEVSAGKGGKVVIDPAILTIQNDSSAPHSSSSGSYGSSFCPTSACVGRGFIEGQLNSSNDVLLVADQEFRSSGGPFSITATSGSGDLAIKVGTVGTSSFSCSAFGVCSGAPSFSADATGDINLANVSVNILGDLDASAGTLSGNVNLGSIRSGNVHLTAGASAGNINVAQSIGGGGTLSAASSQLSLQAIGGNINVNGNVRLTGSILANLDLDAALATGSVIINGAVVATAASGRAVIDIDANTINVGTGIRAFGGTSADAIIDGSGNIAIGGATIANATSGVAQVDFDATGTLVVANTLANGTSGSITLRGNSVVINGAINATGTSAARLNVIAVNNVSLTGAGVTLTEGGGGIARAQFIGNGLGVFNAPINVTAGTGGMGQVSFGSAGTAFNNLIIQQRVKVLGGAGAYIDATVNNSIITTGAGLLDAHEVQVFTQGVLPTVDIDTVAAGLYFGISGGPPNLTVNNSAFFGPSAIYFGGGSSSVLRAASFLSTANLTVVDPFQANSLLVGASAGLVSFDAPVFITGTNPLSPTLPDIETFKIMLRRGLSPPDHGPNVQILGANGIQMTKPFVLGGPNPFIKLFSSKGFNTPGLTSAAEHTLAVFNPINRASPLLFGDVPRLTPPGALALFNFPNLQSLPDGPGTTIVIGEKGPFLPFLSGEVTIGPDGIDLGNRNMFIISRGSVKGDDLVRTNGIFEIIGLAVKNIFQRPVVQEFNDLEEKDKEKDDEELAIGKGNESESGDSEISEEPNAQSMECAA